MNDKNLKLRYFFYFISSFLLISFILNILKERELTFTLNNYKKNIQKEYTKNFDNYKDISELIYFNEFIRDKKLIDIFKNNTDLNSLKKQLHRDFENSFLFYKTLGLSEMNFYTSENKLILSMEDNVIDNFTSNIVKNIILDKKELINYKIKNSSIFLIFSKPIFDEKLNFLGVVNLEFNIDTLLNRLAKDNDSIFRILESNNFHLNEKIFLNMKKAQREELTNSIKNQKEFLKVLNHHLGKIPLVLIPIMDSSYNKNIIYLLAYDDRKRNDLYKINYYFDSLFVIYIFILIIAFYLLYRTTYFKIKNEKINIKHQILIDQINNYIMKVETDLKGNIIFATKAFYKISGYTKEDMIGKNINILRHPDVSKIFFETLWKELKLEKVWEGEIKNIDKYGNSYWIKAVIFPRYNLDKKVEGYSSIRINITDTKQLEKINRLLKEDLSSKLNDIKYKNNTLLDSTKVQLMSKILDSFSHQWKVPVSKISFEIQKINKFTNNKDNIALLNIEKNIDLELKKLSNILNEIKYLFNEKDTKKINLNLLIDEIIINLKDKFEENNIKVKFDIASEINIAIPLNELKNIFLNLFKNCIEQVELNKAENTTIYISAISEDLDKDNDVVIKFEDNIKGLSKKKIIDEIFSSNEEKYFDTHLYLSKLFIEKNKGLFWCNNTIYNTTYFIKLNKEE
jgi:PAS domain S-box-containing protein